jgi:hypothetical protein
MNILTDEEIKRIGEGELGMWQDDLKFARNIEAAIMAKFEVVAEVHTHASYGMSVINLVHDDKPSLKEGTQLYALKEKP